ARAATGRLTHGGSTFRLRPLLRRGLQLNANYGLNANFSRKSTLHLKSIIPPQPPCLYPILRPKSLCRMLAKALSMGLTRRLPKRRAKLARLTTVYAQGIMGKILALRAHQRTGYFLIRRNKGF